MRLLATLLLLVFATASVSAQTFTTTTSGNWSDPTIWDMGTVPTSGADVVIDNTVVFDVDATIGNLTLNNNTRLRFSADAARDMTVQGDILISTDARFEPENRTFATPEAHMLTLSGNMTGDGRFDFRVGSNGGGTAAAVDVSLVGSTNTIINLTGDDTGSALDAFAGVTRANEMNALTVNKTGGARVVMQSSIELSNNSSTLPAALTLTSGIVEVLPGQVFLVASSASGNLVGGSAASHVFGTFGYGMSSSGGTADFPVGDGTYRPISIGYSGPGANTPYLLVTLVNADADATPGNNTSPLLNASRTRYYTVQYDDEGENANADLTEFSITYNADDGVGDGNNDLRVATSPARDVWTERGGAGHTTMSSGGTITSDATSIAVTDGTLINLALGTVQTSNQLPVELAAFSAVADGNAVNASWRTASETNNAGFALELQAEGTTLWTRAGWTDGQGTTLEATDYAFRVTDLAPGRYTLRLRQHDLDGSIHLGATTEITIAAERLTVFATDARPVGSSASWSVAGAQGEVTAHVVDLLGRRVATLARGEAVQSLSFDASSVPSGIYLLRVADAKGAQTHSFVVAR